MARRARPHRHRYPRIPSPAGKGSREPPPENGLPSTGRSPFLNIPDLGTPTALSMDWTNYLPIIVPIIVASVLAIGGYVTSGIAARWLRQRGAPPAAVRWARLVVSLIGILLAAAVLFIAFGPLTVPGGLTLSAVVGLGATLALQTTIGNVIAGFILLRDRVLRLGDRIQIGGVTGTVVRLGLVTTWLRLDDGSLASVSNSNMLSGPLVSKSAGDRLQGEI